jgi:hypothetical protein
MSFSVELPKNSGLSCSVNLTERAANFHELIWPVGASTLFHFAWPSESYNATNLSRTCDRRNGKPLWLYVVRRSIQRFRGQLFWWRNDILREEV